MSCTTPPRQTPLYTTFRGKRVQLLGVGNPDGGHESRPGLDAAPSGTLYFPPPPTPGTGEPTLLVRCAQGTWLPCSRVRVEGKREQGIPDFRNGYAPRHGERFGA
jgi:hypothetical protein